LKRRAARRIVDADAGRTACCHRQAARKEGNVPEGKFLSKDEIVRLGVMASLGADEQGVSESDLLALTEYAYDARVRITIVDLILKGLVVPHMVDGDVVIRLATSGELARIHGLSIPPTPEAG
jgi:hypothetical protein